MTEAERSRAAENLLWSALDQLNQHRGYPAEARILDAGGKVERTINISSYEHGQDNHGEFCRRICLTAAHALMIVPNPNANLNLRSWMMLLSAFSRTASPHEEAIGQRAPAIARRRWNRSMYPNAHA